MTKRYQQLPPRFMLLLDSDGGYEFTSESPCAYKSRPVDAGGQRGIAPNNSPRLYIEVYYTALFNHVSVEFYPILNQEAP